MCVMAGLGVLIVEDDEAISAPLARGLVREGYDVSLAVDGPTGLAAGLRPEVAVVILDVGLPFLDGLEVCRRLRARRPRLQILLLTAQSEEVHAVDGLDAGADDYVAKPFRLAELLARVRAAARRANPPDLIHGLLRIDTGARRAYQDDRELDLSPKEYALLLCLMTDAGQVVTREQLLRDVWQSTWHGPSRSLDQHVSLLRAKLGTEQIVTVRGNGFRLGDAP
jgi:DNA-binding response OmpR family regulator